MSLFKSLGTGRLGIFHSFRLVILSNQIKTIFMIGKQHVFKIPKYINKILIETALYIFIQTEKHNKIKTVI